MSDEETTKGIDEERETIVEIILDDEFIDIYCKLKEQCKDTVAVLKSPLHLKPRQKTV